MNEIAIQIRPMPSPRPRVYGKRTVMPEPYMDYKSVIENKCKSFSKIDGDIKATLLFHFKKSKSHGRNKMSMPVGDCDNLAKSVLDALEGIAYENDRQIVELIVKKGYSDTDLVEIRLEKVEND